jgi:nucleotide-binding universal stress UspA family protein
LKDAYDATRAERESHLKLVQAQLEAEGFTVESHIRPGFIADATQALVAELDIQLVIVTTRGKSGSRHWLRGGVSQKLTQKLDIPILLVQGDPPTATAPPPLERILVTLDGSIRSEKVLPYARAFAKAFNSELILLSVPEVPEVKNYRAADELLENLRTEAEHKMGAFLNAVAKSLREEGVRVRAFVTGSIPEKTIIALGDQEQIDMTMLTSRGRGGLDLLFSGSVARKVVEDSPHPVVLVPVSNGNRAEPAEVKTAG